MLCMLPQPKILGCQKKTHSLTSLIQGQMMNNTTVLGLGVEHRQIAEQDSQRTTHDQGLSPSQRQSRCQHH
jgi:hypothetical protein